jgi:hypothetical protein
MGTTTDDTSPTLDELLLDVATEIELTDHDREIAERRYQRLKTHLERPTSPLAPFLATDSGEIYPQGSMAVGTTIVSGDDDDRYDVDAIVEIEVPDWWAPDKVMDKLEESLQSFPGVEKIVRCTRCVQLQFAQMHMDVTVLDPEDEPRPDRWGDIFHVPDTGEHGRVPSNPYGFAKWYRTVVVPVTAFEKALASRRPTVSRDRLQETAMERIATLAAQEKLAPMIPPRLDSPQVVALKLLKRYRNVKYQRLTLKCPPSIYMTKHSADVGVIPTGLTDQLIALAKYTSTQLKESMGLKHKPDERNPTYEKDRINDRWPATEQDKSTFAKALDDLVSALTKAKSASLGEIKALLSDLFGERISTRAYGTFVERLDQTNSPKSLHYQKGTGTVLTNVAVASPAIVRSPAPRQNFHLGVLKKRK